VLGEWGNVAIPTLVLRSGISAFTIYEPYLVAMNPQQTTQTDPYINEIKTRGEYMSEIETKINIEIGYRFWKKYVNAAFWSYISLPINLSITMLTALSTGQAATNNLLPKQLYVNISLATLVISILNTYFRPYVQMNQNIDFMNKWSVLGYKFEEIFYSEKKTLEQINMRISRYDELLKNINELKKTEILETQNFLTDSIHLGLRSCVCCLKNKNSWLSLDESLKQEDADAKKPKRESHPLSIQNAEGVSPDNLQLPERNMIVGVSSHTLYSPPLPPLLGVSAENPEPDLGELESKV
jgi:hypothetical protein